MSGTDESYMSQALALASQAGNRGEIPVGCVVVWNHLVVGRGSNQREGDRDPTAHAEMLALRQAARVLGRWRLAGCTLYVTLEPCPMCAGAMVLARIDRLVYAAPDPKAGAVASLYQLGRDERLNHRFAVTGGVLADEGAARLREFFGRLRCGNAPSRDGV